MEWAEHETADNDRITLFVAFNYGGRAEIVDAAARYEGGGEEEFRKLLYAPEMHDPDLIIRTSGEQRMSNYLLWQGGLLRARVRRRAVARLLAARRSARRWTSTSAASAASGAADGRQPARTPSGCAARRTTQRDGRPRGAAASWRSRR